MERYEKYDYIEKLLFKALVKWNQNAKKNHKIKQDE